MHSNGLMSHRKGCKLAFHYSINERLSIDGPTGCICDQEVLMQNALQGSPVTVNFRVDPRVIQSNQLRLRRQFSRSFRGGVSARARCSQ